MDVSALNFKSELVRRYREEGYWAATTSNEALEEAARRFPNKVALVDARRRITYAQYYRAAQRLAAHWLSLDLTKDDVIGIQLPNWNEFGIAVNSAMLVGIPFCQFHADFRSKEVELVLGFTGAAAVIVPREFHGFDYMAMLRALRPRLPKLKHILVVGDDVQGGGPYPQHDELSGGLPQPGPCDHRGQRLPAVPARRRQEVVSSTAGRGMRCRRAANPPPRGADATMTPP